MKMELSELHDCEKSRGKIVMIGISSGRTTCGYSHKVVNYTSWFEEELRKQENSVS